PTGTISGVSLILINPYFDKHRFYSLSYRESKILNLNAWNPFSIQNKPQEFVEMTLLFHKCLSSIFVFN
ncbi:MAG TPA: hypothetical protein PK079_24470, partial [Leptospiraceae bacterium]|nr:hypothetical protein [Leptospiraceae bacterium]